MIAHPQEKDNRTGKTGRISSLACPGATIYSFDHTPIAPIGYEQTDHYQSYKRFMNDRHTCLDSD